MSKKVEWQIIYETPYINEAEIIAGRLKHEGIQAMVDHIAGYNALGVAHNFFGGQVKVLVHPADYDIAYAILFAEEDALPDSTQDENTIYYDDWSADDATE